jgi:hypothetical protein
MEQNIIDDILMDLYTRRKSYKQQIVWEKEKMERKLKQIERKKKLQKLNELT